MKKFNFWDLFKKNENKRHRHNNEIISGKLFVNSDGEIHLELPEKPHQVMVSFKGEQTCIPCNSAQRDSIRWYLCNFHRHHCLIINWNVSDTREISWKVIL